MTLLFLLRWDCYKMRLLFLIYRTLSRDFSYSMYLFLLQIRWDCYFSFRERFPVLSLSDPKVGWFPMVCLFWRDTNSCRDMIKFQEIIWEWIVYTQTNLVLCVLVHKNTQTRLVNGLSRLCPFQWEWIVYTQTNLGMDCVHTRTQEPIWINESSVKPKSTSN